MIVGDTYKSARSQALLDSVSAFTDGGRIPDEQQEEIQELLDRGRLVEGLDKLLSATLYVDSELLQSPQGDESTTASAESAWYRGLQPSTYRELIEKGFNSRADCTALAADELKTYKRAIALPGWEKTKRCWSYSEKRLSLRLVNEVRVWLGVAPYAIPSRIPNNAEIQRARRLLEQHGWQVIPPKNECLTH